jgi:hypothetical protein
VTDTRGSRSTVRCGGSWYLGPEQASVGAEGQRTGSRQISYAEDPGVGRQAESDAGQVLREEQNFPDWTVFGK